MTRSGWALLGLVLVAGFLMAARPLATYLYMPFGYAVARGELPAFSSVHKFGSNNDVDGTEESVWEGNDFSGPSRCPTDTVAFTLYASSTSGSDTVTMDVQGLDENWDEQSVSITLTGQTAVQVGDATGWLRVNRAYNTSGTLLVGNVYLHIDATPTAGVPDTPATDIKTMVTIAEQQTMQTCYTVARNKAAYVNRFCASTLNLGGTIPAQFRLRRADLDGVSRTQTKWTLGSEQAFCESFSPPLAIAGQSLIEATAISTTNSLVAASFDMVILPE